MSSDSGESEGNPEDVGSFSDSQSRTASRGRAMNDPEDDILPSNMEEAGDPETISTPTNPTRPIHNGYRESLTDDIPQIREQSPQSPSEPRTPIARPAASPDGSIPDDTPSIQGSLLSSPGSSLPQSYFSTPSGKYRPSLKPFERRFSRLSVSPVPSPRGLSPAFLSSHSRQSSISSNIVATRDEDGDQTPQAPWEVVRWTKLKKMSGQLFSEIGKRNFGTPTCLCVAASLVIGTSKGFVLVFDYHQVLKSIIGPGTKAIECGKVTALAISADHSTIAGGHADGHIFTWEIARPAKPFLHIPPLERTQLGERKGDGHIAGTAVLHIGFLGTRHTALVSADDGGMAFAHLATRGLGAVARTVRTTRILGRYPIASRPSEKPRKASSVLAFAPLPLGNVEQPTDALGLTALLTPYLLVIVSTTPIAQTQHKSSRPKEIAPHSTLSGCLAWFPAVRLKSSTTAEQQVSRTKLAYSWSNILTILDVESTAAEASDKPPDLQFKPRSRWRSDEAIVAIQWLSRSVLGVLTISQRLIILEDTTLRATDSFDLINKHIYHQDLFTKQLLPVVEELNEEDASMHGVIADAFYMSFRSYKSRLFLLGFDDVSIGTLSNWADRLLALMEEGDVIAALNLATSYYNGDADKLTVGLPEDDVTRHTLVREKLLDLITASLRFTFERKNSFDSDEQKTDRVDALAPACFAACLSMDESDVLFEEVYDSFEADGREMVFFQNLEPYVLDDTVTTVPPNVLKDMITAYAADDRASRLQEMIIRLDTQTMDLDLVTTLCRQYSLYDALIYVWNRAISDYITPFLDLLSLIDIIVQTNVRDEAIMGAYGESAMKLFPYLASSLSGQSYPNGAILGDLEASKAKTDLYSFILAGSAKEWPPGSGNYFRSHSNDTETAFPYLQLILHFDSATFMSMLNEVFEDSFLDGDQASLGNGHPAQSSKGRQSTSFVPTRQYIINILLGVLSEEQFETDDRIYFHMFVARNLPKYPQYINLPGSTLHSILVGLCNYPSEDLKEDCQLSVEYLLSVYHPSNLQALIELFHDAGFYRVLKSVYRNMKDYPKLLEAYLNDYEDRSEVFTCIRDCLKPAQSLSKRQISDIHEVMVARAVDLAAIDAARTAKVVRSSAPTLQSRMIEVLGLEPRAQYDYLQALLEPDRTGTTGQRAAQHELSQDNKELYVRLMCRFEPSRVSDFVSHMSSSDLRLDGVLGALEESGVVDAAITLLTRDGLVQRAMGRLVEHLKALETALTGLLVAAHESPDTANTGEAIDDLLAAVDKYCHVGVWLCQGQTQLASRSSEVRSRKPVTEQTEADLQDHELLWLDLIDIAVELTKNVASSLPSDIDAQTATGLDVSRITNALRSSVQQIFTALLAVTTSTQPKQKESSTTVSTLGKQQSPFLSILRAFLTRASRSSPALSDLRSVLSLIFTAYNFEETILSLSSRFLEKDAFIQVAELQGLRERGWRPRGQICEGCRRRAWGPGAGGIIWEKWEQKEKRDKAMRLQKMQRGADNQSSATLGRGKGRAASETLEDSAQAEGISDGETSNKAKEDMGPVIVFACRHMFHRKCLDKSQEQSKDVVSVNAPGAQKEPSTQERGRRYACPLTH